MSRYHRKRLTTVNATPKRRQQAQGGCSETRKQKDTRYSGGINLNGIFYVDAGCAGNGNHLLNEMFALRKNAKGAICMCFLYIIHAFKCFLMGMKKTVHSFCASACKGVFAAGA